MSYEELMQKDSEYVAGFYAGENLTEFREDKSEEWKKGYADGMSQASDDCEDCLF